VRKIQMIDQQLNQVRREFRVDVLQTGIAELRQRPSARRPC
jgi:hypothetical protein